MKYLMHLTEDDFQELLNKTVAAHFEKIEASLHELRDRSDNELLKIDEVMSMLNVCKKTVHNWVKQKKLRCHWIGSTLYFKRKDVLNALQPNF